MHCRQKKDTTYYLARCSDWNATPAPRKTHKSCGKTRPHYAGLVTEHMVTLCRVDCKGTLEYHNSPSVRCMVSSPTSHLQLGSLVCVLFCGLWDSHPVELVDANEMAEVVLLCFLSSLFTFLGNSMDSALWRHERFRLHSLIHFRECSARVEQPDQLFGRHRRQGSQIWCDLWWWTGNWYIDASQGSKNTKSIKVETYHRNLLPHDIMIHLKVGQIWCKKLNRNF